MLSISRAVELDRYLNLPPRRGEPELWTDDRINHIRHLALTGRPLRAWTPRVHVRTRTLERLGFKGVKRPLDDDGGPSELVPDGVDTSSEICHGILLSTPIYFGDMSFGALSGIPNIVLARVADITNVIAGTGEGGLHPEVAKHKRIFIQWASARFGVSIHTLTKGLGIVIKIGQGAKPGIGGHLPGTKVVEPISITRRIPVGVDAISPAPHHDIYSIEDLEQRIKALKEATGLPVFVKVAATNYIPFIATGVARMGADGVIIDGHFAGTGAAPQVVRDQVGLPIEYAVASAHEMLKQDGLREGFTIIAGGGVTNTEEASKLIALGADVVMLGTAALIAMGCIIARRCHLGSCPALITNRITLEARRVLSIEKATEWLTNFIEGWTSELKMILSELGLGSVRELVGRKDLLDPDSVDERSSEMLGLR